jgi:hypothetical protein
MARLARSLEICSERVTDSRSGVGTPSMLSRTTCIADCACEDTNEQLRSRQVVESDPFMRCALSVLQENRDCSPMPLQR